MWNIWECFFFCFMTSHKYQKTSAIHMLMELWYNLLQDLYASWKPWNFWSRCTRPWKSLKFSFIHFGPLKSLFDLRNIFKPPKNLGKYQFEANRIKLTSRKWRSGMDCLWCERLRSRMITSHLVPWFVPYCRGVVWDFKYVHTERKSSGKWVHLIPQKRCGL